MTINEYIQIVGAIIITLCAIGIGTVVTFMVLFMWAALRENWHD